MRLRLLPLCLVLIAVPALPASAQVPSSWGNELPDPAMIAAVPVDSVTDKSFPVPPLPRPPAQVRAIYLNAWTFGSSRFYDLVRLADTTEINAFVIDVKDDTGYLTYASSVSTAIEIGANGEKRAPDARERLDLLHRKGIYPIARIVVAKDPLLAKRKPDWSVKSTEGGLWRDRLDFAWVDAFNDSIWVYAAELGAEAVRMGFAELQFDYVRFPDEPKSRMATALFPARRAGETTRQGVARNVRLLGDRIEPLGVPYTLDVFGMATSARSDLGIGQVWEDLAKEADVLLPMVYPSHYYYSFHGIDKPNYEPYMIVRKALEDGIERSAKLENPAKIRPYLQAFTLGPPRYTPYHVREQIRAVNDVGLDGWVLWNAGAHYDPVIFEPNWSASRRDSLVAADSTSRLFPVRDITVPSEPAPAPTP